MADPRKPEARVHTVLFHLHEAPEQVKLVSLKKSEKWLPLHEDGMQQFLDLEMFHTMMWVVPTQTQRTSMGVHWALTCVLYLHSNIFVKSIHNFYAF
jgi:hypothetical protein